MSDRPWRDDLLTIAPPALKGSACGHCGRRTFPPRDVCPECRSDDAQQDISLGADGVLFSYTVIRQAPPGVDVPYLLGYVDLPADDVRILSRIEEVDVDDLQIGMPLQMRLTTFEQADDGARLGWSFGPGSKETLA